MAYGHPEPFFRTARNAWYVQIGSRQIKLGADKDAAFRKYHELMAAPQEIPVAATASTLVVVVVDAFLEFVQKNLAADTYRWYADRLNEFCRFIPATLTVRDLKPFFVQKWIDSRDDLSSGSKRNMCRTIIRAMNWAEGQGYVERSPLAHFKKPRGGQREEILSDAEFKMLLAHVPDEEFRDLLITAWESGCRPQEVTKVQSHHLDEKGSRWIFPASEAKGARLPRIVYLTPAALAITVRLAAKYPNGPLFRNSEGRGWTADAINCRFGRLRKKLGIKACLYTLRHTWATKMLMRGVDSITVAALMGHTDPTMLARHYAHVGRSPEYLLEQAKRASA
jgi:integrase